MVSAQTVLGSFQKNFFYDRSCVMQLANQVSAPQIPDEL
jgi:hypothetical protein